MIEIMVNIRFVCAIIIAILAIPVFCVFVNVTYWDNSKILFLDKQLSLYPNKYKGIDFMSIGTRFQGYCVTYPFLIKKITSKSKLFHLVMTMCSLWVYSIVILIACNVLIKIISM